MNLWHDKSYIAPSGPEWVERGYAMYDVHSVRFQFVYTEEQKKANRRAHTAADEGQALVMAAEARNSVMNPLMDAIAQNFVCYQYEDTEPAPFRSCQWDLFFWCNDFSSTLHGYGLSGRDYSYFTLSFNENQTVKSVPRSAGGCCNFWNTAAGKTAIWMLPSSTASGTTMRRSKKMLTE